MFGVQRNWHVRAAAIGGVVLIHVVVIISILQHRAEVNTEGGSREMFRPVIHEGGGEQKLTGLRRKPTYEQDQVIDDEAVADSEWRFPPADIWPSHANSVPGTELSSFTGKSATPLDPIEPPPGAGKHGVPVTSTLRLLRWMRPNYSPESAGAGEEGTALLRLHIDESGKPLDVHLAQSTRFARLDESALQAARAWTFSPPLNHSQPVSTWAQIEIRFHAQ